MDKFLFAFRLKLSVSRFVSLFAFVYFSPHSLGDVWLLVGVTPPRTLSWGSWCWMESKSHRRRRMNMRPDLFCEVKALSALLTGRDGP